MQRGIKRDSQMVTMLRNGPGDPALVMSWMRDYGLFQGISTRNRATIVARLLRFAGAHKESTRTLGEEDIADLYTALFTALYREVARSWMSATSKLLWCLYPDTIVIYDAFVHRTC